MMGGYGKLLESCSHGDRKGFIKGTGKVALRGQNSLSTITSRKANQQGVDVGGHIKEALFQLLPFLSEMESKPISSESLELY